MRYACFLFCLILSWFAAGMAAGDEMPVSDDTRYCLECHNDATPGVVADWKRSRHARVTVGQAMKVEGAARKLSSKDVPDDVRAFVVGCAECHTQDPDAHPDHFDHEGYPVHTVVTPRDCARCHQAEAEQYTGNKMAHAYGNLMNNALYRDLVNTVNGDYGYHDGRLDTRPADDKTNASSCLSCHGTVVRVTGSELRETDFGDFEIPTLSGWPNQGVGRINPDGSMGSCAACHTRHQFSMAMARKPHTCSQCHSGPDVPAYKIYQVSKHGNLYSSLKGEWDFEPTPWTVGQDFSAPTCAVCHISLLEDKAGNTVAQRSHRMNDRLPWRLLGLIYAHPQPKSPRTDEIRNRDGLPLPTGLDGRYVSEALIDDETRAERTRTMQQVCLSCHTPGWTKGHWTLLENAIQTSNHNVRAATGIISDAWAEGLEKGWAEKPEDRGNFFDESLERRWVETWFFHANSIRLSAAMGGADYGVFENGRFQMSRGLIDMMDRYELKKERVKPAGQ